MKGPKANQGAMAKISELVKTYRLLSDPNAPDWNVKFIGGVVVALALVAAAGALVWSANADNGEQVRTSAPEATAPAPAEPTCTAEEIAEAVAQGASAAAGDRLPSGCVVADP